MQIYKVFYCRVTKDRVQLLIGTYNKSNIEESTRQERSVGDWWFHPGFNRKTFNHDIGVVLLNEPVEYNNNIKPACVADSG